MHCFQLIFCTGGHVGLYWRKSPSLSAVILAVWVGFVSKDPHDYLYKNIQLKAMHCGKVTVSPLVHTKKWTKNHLSMIPRWIGRQCCDALVSHDSDNEIDKQTHKWTEKEEKTNIQQCVNTSDWLSDRLIDWLKWVINWLTGVSDLLPYWVRYIVERDIIVHITYRQPNKIIM